MIFQITAADVERSSTLDEQDIGKWGYLIQGCYQLFESQETAQASYLEVFCSIQKQE
jgi:hypothetical protein